MLLVFEQEQEWIDSLSIFGCCFDSIYAVSLSLYAVSLKFTASFTYQSCNCSTGYVVL